MRSVPRNAKIAREEIFGPVIVICKFKDEDDVVEQANDTMYGLAAAIFSQNITRALRTASRVQAGMSSFALMKKRKIGVGDRQS